jgi:RimJ/RimL family protein N-acetyltransferase
VDTSRQWRKIPLREQSAAEDYLKTREPYCVAACAKFLHLQRSKDHVWALKDAKGGITDLILHSRQSLYPVFGSSRNIPAPRFLKRFFGKAPIHAVQGLEEDVDLLEAAMESRDYFAAERIGYDLMSLDSRPDPSCYRSGPAELIVRPPADSDSEELYRLQAAYEQEEVLPRDAVFSPAACRANLEHLLRSEQMFLAVLNGRIVGKINTSALSFTRCQIGGVYVHPDYRGLGIAVRMAAVFIDSLIDERRGITLFVKKRNRSAQAVYRRIGFVIEGSYRISYY